MTVQERYLSEHGWKPKAGMWLAPVQFASKPHYFTLEAAYDLEVEGEGIHAYSVNQALCEAARGQDVALAANREAAYHLATGKWHGQPPNW